MKTLLSLVLVVGLSACSSNSKCPLMKKCGPGKTTCPVVQEGACQKTSCKKQ